MTRKTVARWVVWFDDGGWQTDVTLYRHAYVASAVAEGIRNESSMPAQIVRVEVPVPPRPRRRRRSR